MFDEWFLRKHLGIDSAGATGDVLSKCFHQLAARFENQAEPTADDVSRTRDGEELRTADQVEDFIATLRNQGLLAG